jgi:hypothetical protein
MAIDPQSPFAPADPSRWWQTRALPRIVVHPKPPNAPPDDSTGADGADDWFVPGQAPAASDAPNDWFVPTTVRADTYPDDWFVPAPVVSPGISPTALNAQPSLGNPGRFNASAAPLDPSRPRASRPAAPARWLGSRRSFCRQTPSLTRTFRLRNGSRRRRSSSIRPGNLRSCRPPRHAYLRSPPEGCSGRWPICRQRVAPPAKACSGP